MNKKIKNNVLLVISGFFLIVASVLVTYTIMNYISFKNEFEKENKNKANSVESEVISSKRPLDNEEMGEFKNLFNSSLTSKFLSSVNYSSLDDLNIVNANLIMYVYPKFEGCNKTASNVYIIEKNKFMEEFYKLTGKRLNEDSITRSSLWNSEDNAIEFSIEPKGMNASIKIDSSYKIEDKYYFSLNIDNNVYGTMKKSILLEKTGENKYTFIYIKSA